MAAPNGSTDVLDEIGSQVPKGVVLPPKNQRHLIEKTAGFVVRNGMSFEERIRSGPTGNKAAFLDPGDAYNEYYKWRMSEIRAGRGTDISAGREHERTAGAVTGGQGGDWKGREERKGPEKPEDFKFSARMPNISAQDLEIVKLTALFVAKNGRSWMTSLSQKEAGNFQFDFLRPQHSLYQFFSRLVDQYTDLLDGATVDGGRPLKRRKADLEENLNDRFKIMERAKKRAEWVKYQESQKVAKAEKEEQERIAFHQIDWQDFVVVETVTFDERDEETPLPAPTTLNDLQSASLEQKAMMRVGSDKRLEEAFPSVNDQEAFYGSQQSTPAAQQPAPAVQMPPQQLPYTPTPPQATTPYRPPQAQGEEPNRLPTQLQEREAARRAQEAARAQHPMKIRSDYVPRAQAKRQAANTSICPNCGQAIANAEMAEHMRIELLDPQWREQSRIALQRSSTTNLNTVDVASNLKRLASQRADLFDQVTGDPISEEEQARRKKAELGAYDGVSQMPSAAALAGMSTVAPGLAGPPGTEGSRHLETADVQEQIRQLHQKYKDGFQGGTQ